MVLIDIIIGAFFGWLFGRLEGVLDKNKSFRNKNEILIGVIGGVLGHIFGSIFLYLIKMMTPCLITYIIFDFIGVALIFFLAMEIKKTKLKMYLDLWLFKLSPFIGVISIYKTCVEFSSVNLSSSVGVLLIGAFFILFSVFVLWGIIKFFNNNNYFKNKYLFLLLYSIPIVLFLSDRFYMLTQYS